MMFWPFFISCSHFLGSGSVRECKTLTRGDERHLQIRTFDDLECDGVADLRDSADSGVVIDGIGCGTATIRKAGAVLVGIE